MLTLAAISVAGLLVAIVVAAIVYFVGVYLFHAPQPIVGLIALLILVLLLIGTGGFKIH